jgi:hypothetical protein
MTLKLMFKYLIGIVLIVGVFAHLTWDRTEYILKDYIVNQAMTQLHIATANKVNEVEARVKYYQLASQKIVEKLLVSRENFGPEGIEADIVAVDLFNLKDGRYSVSSNFTNTDFLSNRSFSHDFIKETVGANPLDFSRLQFEKHFVQKLTAADKKTQLLAIVSQMPDNSGVVVVYADIQRFQALFTPVPGFSQFMFESVGGIIAQTGETLTVDVNEHPALVELNKNSKSVIQTKYFDKVTTENHYASLVKSAAGFYVLTEASEGYLWQSVYLLKANLSKAVGVLFSCLVVLLSLMGLFANQKMKHLSQQLEDYAQRREIKSAIKGSALKDEFDLLSQHINNTFVNVERSSKLGDVIQKFDHVNLAEKLNYKSVNLELSESDVLAVQIELVGYDLDTPPEEIVSDYKMIRKSIEILVAQTNGVVVTQLDSTLTLAWGLFDEKQQTDLRGLNTLLDIENYLKQALDTFKYVKSYLITVSRGKATVHFSQATGKMMYIGQPFTDVRRMSFVCASKPQNIFVSFGVAKVASDYFNFEKENAFADVARLTHRTREIVNVAS